MRPREYLIPIYLWISASLLLHLLLAGGTRAIADRVGVDRPRLLAQPGAGAPNVSEVEFDFPPEAPPPPAAALPTPPTPSPRVARRAVRPPATPPPASRPEPPRPPAPVVPVAVTPVVPPAVRPPSLQRFVDQVNPNEEPVPEDPQHLAQSNRNVAEETQAVVRNLDRDQANPRAGGAPNRADPSHPGNADRQVSADAQNTDGRSDRVPDPRPRTAAAAVRPNPTPPPQGDRAPGSGATPSTAGAVGREGAAGDPVPGGAGAIEVASGAQGANGQSGGGATQTATGGYQGLRGMGAARALGALTPTWTTYASIIGDARIQREAEEARQRRSAARGSFTDGWQDTRAAIENFVPHVRVGNQTALRTAASPFAAYLTAMHRRIHRLFADGFLEGLGRVPANSPMQDEALVTTVEIVLERSGTVHSLGIVRSSGVLPFDVAALNSVRRSAPFGDAPTAILSGDGRVYVRWGFHRDHRQCGTFNAEPFILPSPGASPPRSPSPTTPSRTTDEGPPARLGFAPVATGVPGSRG